MATTTSFDLDTYLKSKKAVVETALDKSLTVTTPRVDKIIESMSKRFTTQVLKQLFKALHNLEITILHQV